MEINPNRNVDPALLAGAPAKSRVQAQASRETLFEGSANLNAALEATPDSRADVVRRAEGLVSSPTYPPQEVIKRIANLLGGNLIVNEN